LQPLLFVAAKKDFGDRARKMIPTAVRKGGNGSMAGEDGEGGELKEVE